MLRQFPQGYTLLGCARNEYRCYQAHTEEQYWKYCKFLSRRVLDIIMEAGLILLEYMRDDNKCADYLTKCHR